jgi:hypothetical protein
MANITADELESILKDAPESYLAVAGYCSMALPKASWAHIIAALREWEKRDASNPKRWVDGYGGDMLYENNHGTLGTVVTCNSHYLAWVRGELVDTCKSLAIAKLAVEQAVKNG